MTESAPIEAAPPPARVIDYQVARPPDISEFRWVFIGGIIYSAARLLQLLITRLRTSGTVHLAYRGTHLFVWLVDVVTLVIIGAACLSALRRRASFGGTRAWIGAAVLVALLVHVLGNIDVISRMVDQIASPLLLRASVVEAVGLAVLVALWPVVMTWVLCSRRGPPGSLLRKLIVGAIVLAMVVALRYGLPMLFWVLAEGFNPLWQGMRRNPFNFAKLAEVALPLVAAMLCAVALRREAAARPLLTLSSALVLVPILVWFSAVYVQNWRYPQHGQDHRDATLSFISSLVAVTFEYLPLVVPTLMLWIPDDSKRKLAHDQTGITRRAHG